MKLYNTLTKAKEEFKPLKDKIANIYTCGPTVYDYAHIGNFRSYIAADLLRRFLEYDGYKIIQVKNITDVGHLTENDLDQGEDKIEKKAREKKLTPETIARFYEKAFLKDEQKLNIKKADYYPRATEHIPEMIETIKELLKKDCAYEKEGAVFFDIAKFPSYGKLSGNTQEKLSAGIRVKPDKRKTNPFDFYLWRPAEKNHLMRWPSPWGEGYPGWHLECSVMSNKYLGETLDIHSGGEDNIFPHHENEIAQSEALSGKQFVRFWFHPRYLLVNDEKMAKSKGNFYTLRDLEKKGYHPLEFRLLILSVHYRSPLNFTFKSLDQARENLKTIYEFLSRLGAVKNKKTDQKDKIDQLIGNFKRDFVATLGDDLDTPKALAFLFQFISDINTAIDKNAITKNQAQEIYQLILNLDKILGVLDQKKLNAEIPENIKILVQKRENLRKQNQWEEADKIRQEIEGLGYDIKDTSTETIIQLKK